MKTEELIAQLALQTRPVAQYAAMRRLCLAVCTGGLIAFALLLVGPGIRPDIAEASATPPFWMKWLFTLSLTVAASVVVRRLGNPEGKVGFAWLGVCLPFLVVAMMAIGELQAAPESQRLGLVMGHTASKCPPGILVLSVPGFIACIWAFRRLAPTRLRLTGAMAGILSAAAGAAIYAFACPETSAAFMVTWYTAGIVAGGIAGYLIGPRFLKW